MLVLQHPHGTASSGYLPAHTVATDPTAALSNNVRVCHISSTSQQKPHCLLSPPPFLTVPLHQRQPHLQSREVLSVPVQQPACLAASLYSSATPQILALSSCTPAPLRWSPLQQVSLQQPCVSQLPNTAPSPFGGSACTFPFTTVLDTRNFSCFPVATTAPALYPTVPLCLQYPEQGAQYVLGPLGEQTLLVPAAGQEGLQPDSSAAAKEKQRLLHKTDDAVQQACAEDLCEREDKYQQGFASTLEQQQEARQQKEREQQPPLWRIPTVRDPLAVAAAEFNPIAVSDATLVRHLWKHARAAVEDPMSTPPFHWVPPPLEPSPSQWTTLHHHERRPTQLQLVQRRQARSTEDYTEYYQPMNVCLSEGPQQDAAEEGAEADTLEAPEDNRRRRRRGTTADGRRRYKKSSGDAAEWQTESGMETAAQCGAGAEHTQQTAPVLSTRLGRSQSPRYLCPRRDDFTAEQLVDAPAYTTSYVGLLPDTGMHYTKHYELPTLSRFLQAKHPVFLRARTPADERQQQSRSSSRDIGRARTSRSYGRRKQKEHEGSSEEGRSVDEDKRGITGTAISSLLPAISSVAVPAAILLHPPALQQDSSIIPAAPVPTVAVSWPHRADLVAHAQAQQVETTTAGREGSNTLTDRALGQPALTTAVEGILPNGAMSSCTAPQTTISCVPSTIHSHVGCSGSQLPSFEESAASAVILPSTSLYSHATVHQNPALVNIQSAPPVCSPNTFSQPFCQLPHTAMLPVAQPVALSGLAAASPDLVSLGSGTNAVVVEPESNAACGAPPWQRRADTPASSVRCTVGHVEENKMLGQSQNETQPQTIRETEHERRVGLDIQQQHNSELLESRKVQTFQEPGQHQQEGKSSMQHEESQFCEQRRPLEQRECSPKYPPQTPSADQEPHGSIQRHTSYQGQPIFTSYLFSTERFPVLVPSVADAVPHAGAIVPTAALSGEASTLPVEESKPTAVLLSIPRDTTGVPAASDFSVGRATVDHLDESSTYAATPTQVLGVTSGSTVIHPVVSTAHQCGSTDLRGVAPVERRSEPNPRQGRLPSHTAVAAPSNVCALPRVASFTSAAAPTAHVMLRQQQWHPQILVPPPPAAGSAQFVW